MTDFERALVNAFNRYFEDVGLAIRRKQSRFCSQILDVLVFNPYIGIEAKSVKTESHNKLYFSDVFSESDDGHQIPRTTDFLKRAGLPGVLAVELRRGMGRSRRAYFVDWREVDEKYRGAPKGIRLDELNDGLESVQIRRDGGDYHIDDRVLTWLEGLESHGV